MKPIYLDYNATTPLDPEVLEEMLPYFKVEFGNPSSSHFYGMPAKKAVAVARERVAGLLDCLPDEIIFTSGGSESNNHAIKGAAYSLREKGDHIIVSKVEHPSVLEVCSFLEEQGFRITYLPVNGFGAVGPAELADAITPGTILISVMHANNEVGTIEPVAELAKLAKERGILFHTDAAQSAGKIVTDSNKMGVDLLSLAGHKLYAPKGVGALFVRRGVRLASLVHGATQEGGRRAGTENVPYVVALGKACEIAAGNLAKNAENMKKRRDELYDGLKRVVPGVLLNGDPGMRLPNTLSVSFPGVSASLLLSELTDIAASPGAACHADREEVSHVLRAMGYAEDRGFNTIRFSTGKATTAGEIAEAVKMIGGAVGRLGGSEISSLRNESKRSGPAPAYHEDERRFATAAIDVADVSSGMIPAEPEPQSKIKLTRYTQGLGCACKIKPKILEDVLAKLPVPKDARILVGTETKDDAAVFRIDKDLAIVQTVDFFTPVVDDPEAFGAIAAANSLSDIYAMGATPLFALNVAAFPSRRLPSYVLSNILKGAEKKASQAGIPVIGGHTIEDDEPKYGLVVTGTVHPDKILRNSTARPGDMLVLTKAIGTGIVATALKRGAGSVQDEARIVDIMSALNDRASSLMIECGAGACTDITGFGLLGHALEMALGSDVSITLFADKVPLVAGVLQYARMGIYPGGTVANLEFVGKSVGWDGKIPDYVKLILADAQTSGGLLISIEKRRASELLEKLHKSGMRDAALIGTVEEKADFAIIVK